MNKNEEFMANILIIKKHQVILKQTWIAEIEFNVVYYQI